MNTTPHLTPQEVIDLYREKFGDGLKDAKITERGEGTQKVKGYNIWLRVDRHREMKRLLFKLTNGELCDVATVQPYDDILYGQNTVLYLRQLRQVPDVFHFLPVGVLPPEKRLKDLFDGYCLRENIEKKEQKEQWTALREYLNPVYQDVRWVGGLLFFSGDSPQDPCKVKIRRIPNYTNGMFQDEDKKDVMFLTDSDEEHNGLFGLFGTDLYKPFFASKDIRSFYLVEGEFDALSIMARQFETGKIGFFCFSGGGGSVGSMDFMSNYGFDTGYVTGDCDEAGDGFVQDVMKNTIKVAVRAFRWPENMRLPHDAKVDPDSVTLYHGLDAVEEEFRRESNCVAIPLGVTTCPRRNVTA